MTSDQAGPQSRPPAGCPAHTYRTPLYGPDFAADPHTVYAKLREQGPLAPVELAPGVPATLVVGYHAALEVLRDPLNFPKDPRRWQARVAPDCPVLPMMGYRPNCVCTDGAEHARLRGAVTDSMGRLDLNTLRTSVENIADTLIDRFVAGGKADLISEYARALPLMVLSLLFGCPPVLGDRMVRAMTGIFDMIEPEKANAALVGSLRELVALKRAQPGPDVTSWLAAHPSRLTDEEMVSQLAAVMGAGADPEMNLIAGGLRLMLSDDKFAGDLSSGSLPIEDALEEVLWTDPPMANFGVTYPLQDLDFAGVRLPEAQPVVISFAAANADPLIAFQQRTGNRAHLAWSAGAHTCPAQGPARLIASAAIERILDRLPDVELAVPADQLAWRPSPFQRALVALPVRFTPVAPATGGQIQGHSGPARPAAAPWPVTPAGMTWGSRPPGRPGPWNRFRCWWRGE